MRFRGNLQLVEMDGVPDLVRFHCCFRNTMDGDMASQSSKESPNVEEGGQVGFQGEDE